MAPFHLFRSDPETSVARFYLLDRWEERGGLFQERDRWLLVFGDIPAVSWCRSGKKEVGSCWHRKSRGSDASAVSLDTLFISDSRKCICWFIPAGYGAPRFLGCAAVALLTVGQLLLDSVIRFNPFEVEMAITMIWPRLFGAMLIWLDRVAVKEGWGQSHAWLQLQQLPLSCSCYQRVSTWVLLEETLLENRFFGHADLTKNVSECSSFSGSMTIKLLARWLMSFFQTRPPWCCLC